MIIIIIILLGVVAAGSLFTAAIAFHCFAVDQWRADLTRFAIAIGLIGLLLR